MRWLTCVGSRSPPVCCGSEREEKKAADLGISIIRHGHRIDDRKCSDSSDSQGPEHTMPPSAKAQSDHSHQYAGADRATPKRFVKHAADAEKPQKSNSRQGDNPKTQKHDRCKWANPEEREREGRC